MKNMLVKQLENQSQIFQRSESGHDFKVLLTKKASDWPTYIQSTNQRPFIFCGKTTWTQVLNRSDFRKKLNFIIDKLNKHLKKECKQIRYLGKFGILWNKLHIGNNHVQSSNVASFWNMLANMKDILDSESILIQWHSCGCSTYVFWILADIPVCNIQDNSKYYFDVIEYVSFWNISLFLFREKLRIWSWIDWIFFQFFHS